MWKSKLKFWQKVKQTIRKEHGAKPCKDFNLSCSTCQAYMMLSWIDNEIDTLKWANSRNYKLKPK